MAIDLVQKAGWDEGRDRRQSLFALCPAKRTKGETIVPDGLKINDPAQRVEVFFGGQLELSAVG